MRRDAQHTLAIEKSKTERTARACIEFRGQEAEVAIISLVRSNTSQDYYEAIGFLNNSRVCVAFSRGKRKTIIVGDQTTLIKN